MKLCPWVGGIQAVERVEIAAGLTDPFGVVACPCGADLLGDVLGGSHAFPSRWVARIPTHAVEPRTTAASV